MTARGQNCYVKEFFDTYMQSSFCSILPSAHWLIIPVYQVLKELIQCLSTTVNSGKSGLRPIRIFAASGQIFSSLQQPDFSQCILLRSGQNWLNSGKSGYREVRQIRTPRYPDSFRRSLQSPDWPELTVFLQLYQYETQKDAVL